MFKDNPEFELPPDDTTIWRYMDYTKFISLLEDEALFLTRGDKFRDRFEGSVPKAVAEEQLSLYRDLQELDGKVPDDDSTASLEFDQLGRLDRQFVGINCWYIGKSESDAMWQLYLKGHGEGIAVRTTVGHLKKSITDPIRSVFIGRVRYIDYDTDSFDVKSHFSRFLFKRLGFSHENELRVMAQIVANAQGGEIFDFKNRVPEVEDGLKIAVNLQMLIDEIVVAPGAKWLELVTSKVINRYGLRVPVRCTALDAEPHF